MKHLAVLISNAGKGTNLQAIIDQIKNKKINAKISVVISSDKDAYGLKRSKKNSIKTAICPKKENLLNMLKEYNPDLICLAGWKQIIIDEVIEAFPNRIINLHPGLVPDRINGKVNNPDKTRALWNRGKLTDDAVQNFLKREATYAGSSIHFLSEEFDFGKVLGRCFEKIKKGDSVEDLYKRLKVKENKLYALVLEQLCNGGKFKKVIIN